MKKPIFTIAALLCAAWAAAAVPANLSPRTAMAMQASIKQIDADATMSAYIHYSGTLDTEALARLGVNVVRDFGGIATVRMPRTALADLSEAPGITYVQLSTPARQMLDIVRPATGIDAVNSGEGLSQPFTGDGVVVGIVDSGFDYGHGAFRAPDGSLRIARVWEQGWNLDENPREGISAPEAFGYGAELATPEQILSSEGDIRNNSHGTHVTAIAAGSAEYLDGTLRGMAPDAQIVLVSMTKAGDNNVNISNALAYIFDYADAVGLPCVINLSLGANSGPHDGTSTFDVIADRLQGPGRLIVGASGNHTSDKSHICRTASADTQAAPLRTFLNFKYTLNASTFNGEMEMWADAATDPEVDFVVYHTSTGEEVARATAYPIEGTAELELGRNVSGTLNVAAETSPLNGKHHLLVTNALRSIRNNYGVAIEIRPRGAGQIDLWSDGNYMDFTSKNLDGFIEPGGDPTLTEIGGTAKRILTVGAYVTRNEYYLLNETTPKKFDETVGDLGSFSNCGPTADGRMKPQVTAPGCFTVSAVSNYDYSGTIAYAHSWTEADRDNRYGYMQGTSMASPAVAGIVATWLQACPTLTPEQLVEVVQATSRVDEFVTVGSRWGYGKIDALAGVKECAQFNALPAVVAPSAQIFSLNNASLTFLGSAGNARISIVSPSGATVYTATVGAVEAGTEIAIPSLPHGVYILTVETPHTTKSMKFVR